MDVMKEIFRQWLPLKLEWASAKGEFSERIFQ
jgi:hypothetical protein